MPAPKALLLDLVGTVLIEKRWDPVAGFTRVLGQAASDGRVYPDEVFAAFRELYEGMTPRRRDARLEFPLRAVLRNLRDRFRFEFTLPESELEWEFWRDCTWYLPAEGVVDALAEAAHREIPVAILSNNQFSGECIERELKIHGLSGCFRFVLSTADYGLRKPDPLVFLTAAGRLGLPPAAIWYIGDKPEMDIAGARAAGMRAVWYHPEGYAAADPEPDLTLVRWSDLAALLDGGPALPAQ